MLPGAEGQVFHTNYGILEADEEREETTANLPEGSYALTLACRSPRRVSFSVGHDDVELVDLNLRCGTVAGQRGLSARRTSRSPSRWKPTEGANFAYRVSRI